MPSYQVRHLTTYRYRREVGFGDHRIMFRPRDSYDQRLLSATVDITPTPSSFRWQHDVFGNCVAIVTFDTPAKELRFDARISLDHTTLGDLDFTTDPAALEYPFSYSAEEMRDLSPTIQRHYADPGDEIAKWARRFIGKKAHPSTARLLMTLCYAIKESFVYQRRSAHGTQEPLVTLQQRKGTCRDMRCS